MSTPTPGQIWKHYKTQSAYEILGIGKMQVNVDTLDLQTCVIYRSITDQSLWVRLLIDFIEMIMVEEKKVPRFTFVR
jgi:hypothetical protein